MNSQPIQGFSMIELIIFISILGFISVGTFTVNDNVLRLNGEPSQVLQAATLARSRMVIILLRRQQNGYATLADPCSSSTPPAACTLLSSFATARQLTVTSSITESAPNKTIALSVIGTASNHYNLSGRVTDYDQTIYFPKNV